MRREVLVAVILGIGLGVAVAFGIWRANLALSPKKATPTPVINNGATPSPDQTNSDLIITQPENNSVVPKAKVLVKGSATPKATIVILTPADEEIIEAGADGAFEKEIEVAGGPNDIVVKAYDQQGQESIQKVSIVYSTELTETP